VDSSLARRADPFALVAGVLSLLVAVCGVLGIAPWEVVDLRWVLAGTAVVAGIAFLMASVRNSGPHRTTEGSSREPAGWGAPPDPPPPAWQRCPTGVGHREARAGRGGAETSAPPLLRQAPVTPIRWCPGACS
jgi:hypothetical protein